MRRSQRVPFFVAAILAVGLFAACDGVRGHPNLVVQEAALVSVSSGSSVPLLAGQHIQIGAINVYVDGDDLVLAYALEGGWELLEIHLWIGESLADMPQTRTGNPILGHFPFTSGDITGATDYAVRVPLAWLGGDPYICDKTFFVVAHAAVRKALEGGGYQGETAYGGGERLTARGNWATYFAITLTCDDEDPPPVGLCETAFAYGDTTFIDLGIANARWGWQIEVDALGDFDTPIYAGAAQNDITKGLLVGFLKVSYDGALLVVTYDLLPGFGLDETHVYAGEVPIENIAPGLYGHTHSDLGLLQSDTFAIEIDGLPIYLVAHAVVCFLEEGPPQALE